MTLHNQSHHETDEPLPPDNVPLNILITRLADGDAADQDWEEFQRRAAQNHNPWKLLAEEQYLANQLRIGFERIALRTDRVELPASATTAATVTSLQTHDHHIERYQDERPVSILEYVAHFGRTYGGWAAAAALALVWTVSVTLPNHNQNTQQAANGVIPGQTIPDAVSVNDTMTPDQYYDKYLQSPFVVRELQPLLLQSGTNKDGQSVITYMRRIIEKRPVNGIYRRASDGYNDGILVPGTISGLQNNDTIH